MTSTANKSSSHDTQATTNYKDAFSLYDKRGDHLVALKDLGDLLRACGQNPTDADIAALEANVGRDFDFETFSRVLNRPGGFGDVGTVDDYNLAFQSFDKDGTGIIGVGEAKYVLTKFGDKLSDQEFADLIKATGIDTSSGRLDYKGESVVKPSALFQVNALIEELGLTTF